MLFIHGHNGRKQGSRGLGELQAYRDAKKRCTVLKCKSYPDYGGRGIKFLFTSFEQFFAELGPKPSKQYTLDRIDNDGNYEPGNVRWATRLDQTHNRRCTKKGGAE